MYYVTITINILYNMAKIPHNHNGILLYWYSGIGTILRCNTIIIYLLLISIYYASLDVNYVKHILNN